MRQNCDNFIVKPQISFYFKSNCLNVEINTQRLYIHSYRDSDFENCASLYADEKLAKYFDHGKTRSREEVAHLIRENGYKYFSKMKPFGLFSLFDNQTMVFIGQADLLPADEPGTVEIGCILNRKYHNQGFPLEACRALTFEYIEELNCRGFKNDEIQITKVIATAHPKNYASQKLIKNLEMTFDKIQERFGNPRLWYSRVINTVEKDRKM
jgi:RimJ/RimL family protein N-acetyltransferase